MPNLSVKIDDATRQRLHEVAARRGVTPHALMVDAIALELDRAQEQGAFVERALRARAQVEATGQAIDGRTFADYLRARAQGQTAIRPVPLPLDVLLSQVK
jgi:predicted transcriptional regulator